MHNNCFFSPLKFIYLIIQSTPQYFFFAKSFTNNFVIIAFIYLITFDEIFLLYFFFRKWVFESNNSEFRKKAIFKESFVFVSISNFLVSQALFHKIFLEEFELKTGKRKEKFLPFK